MKLLELFLILLWAITNCNALPEGAPESACLTLKPKHSYIEPQTTESPYTVTVNKLDENRVQVTISSPIGDEFQGFILQARSENIPTKIIDGEFTSSAESRTMNCLNMNKNTLTHTRNSPKKGVTTEWTRKDSLNEDVIFKATVLKTYDKYWMNVNSPTVHIKVDMSGTVMDSAFNRCFMSTNCFGLPENCTQSDCTVIANYLPTPDGIEFNLHGFLNPSMYMALGLSKDNSMGDDAVTECVRVDSSVTARESWNEGKSNTRTKSLTSFESSLVNDLSSCSWTQPYQFESNGESFDLVNNDYYILLAVGRVSSAGKLQYHRTRIASKEPANFTISVVPKDDSHTVTPNPKKDSHTVTPNPKKDSEHGETDETKSTFPSTTNEPESKSTSSETTPGVTEKSVASGTLQLSFSIFLSVILKLLYTAEGANMHV